MLPARNVWDEQEARRERRMGAMRTVLGDIQRKIRQQAIHDPRAPYILFEVPPYVFGHPLYRLTEARDYLMNTLTTAGYYVWCVDEKYLLISWMKIGGGRNPQRPVLTTNYRPQVYDPTALGLMQNGLGGVQ